MFSTGAEGSMNGYFTLLYCENFRAFYLSVHILLIIMLDYIAILACFFFLFLCNNT